MTMPLQRIYLDYAAGTPLLPEVKQAMAAALEEQGNPSSIHADGRRARQLLERARVQVAELFNAAATEIFLTACGSESNSWALRGLFAANKRKGNHLIISAIEHPSVSLTARRLELDGAHVTILPVDCEGVVSIVDLKAAMRSETVLVSIMLANGEVGTVEPLKEIAAAAHELGALVHTDAVAAVGHLSIDVRALDIDALSFAASQLYGPQGAAGLFVRDGVRILPLIEGGGQERGARSGTEAVAPIVGMGAAAASARRTLPERAVRLAGLRDRLREGLCDRLQGLRINGSWSSRLPHNLHVCIEGVSSESLVLALDQAGIACGIGSACNSKAMRPSHVLKAMGLTDEQAKGALVISVGVPTSEAEITRAIEVIPEVTERVRRVTLLTARA